VPTDSQSDKPATGHTDRVNGGALSRPVTLAILLTLANTAKPVVVDDTAYLSFARHIASDPLDPYGFTLYWYTRPGPAFEVLCPPVVPYWLGLGIRLFGENVPLLKLWMFPFVYAFVWGLGRLLELLAPNSRSRVLPLVVLSPAFLPTVNFMLDVPAWGLSLSAIAVFWQAAHPGSRGRGHTAGLLTGLAGLLAGLATQTKYTALLCPAVILWSGRVMGRTRRATRRAFWAVAVAGVVFVGWEALLFSRYDRSHFLFHTRDQAGSLAPSELLRQKLELVGPLLGYLGCLGLGPGLVAATALRVPEAWRRLALVVWWVGFTGLLLLPNRLTGPLAVPFWNAFGSAVLLSYFAAAGWLLLRHGGRVRFRPDPRSCFLGGWLVLELFGYFALTPFPAARRVLGVVIVGGLVAARAVGRAERRHGTNLLRGGVLLAAVSSGLAVAALDTFDAYAEIVCAQKAAVSASGGPPGSTVWFAGHWGFQYACERLGMRPLVPGETVVRPGDMLVLPVPPDERGFYRPHIGNEPVRPPADRVEVVAEVVWDDAISGQTIPNFYGGVAPVVGRDHPRLRVVVYRVVRPWRVGSAD
jgi:hypothetical protein